MFGTPQARTHAVFFGVLAVSLASGCADPQGEFDAFHERNVAVSAQQNVDPCGDEECKPPAAAKVSGDYLVSLVAKQFKTKPIVFIGTMNATAGDDGGLDVTLVVQPISKDDRKTKVGEPTPELGPFAVAKDGAFTFDLGPITIPGEANPVTGSEIKADADMIGRMCAPGDFMFGEVTGVAEASITLKLDGGSVFTFQRIEDPANLPNPVIKCDGTEAPPL